MYYVYILRCSDDTLYTGVTTDVDRRVAEHNGSERAAKYTRARQPVELLVSREFPDRSSAQKEEARVKGLRRPAKLAVIQQWLVD